MVDAHCHLNFKAFDQDFDEVIRRAFEAGVIKIINVGTKLETSQRAVDLVQKYENLYATVGIHPHHADKLEPNWEARFEKLAKHPKVVAIGECGMDFYRYSQNSFVDPKQQEKIFIKQIELASKLKLPLQVHNRQAGKEILDILLNHKSYLLNPPAGGPGVFHCMSGDLSFLKKVLGLGFYIGFDGNITYQGIPKGVRKGEATNLGDLVKFTPLERIILETDSPYLAPVPFRGSRNEPKNVIIIAKFIAQLKEVKEEEVKKVTQKNTHDIFFPKNFSPISH